MRDVTKDEVEADCAAAAVLLVNQLLMRYLLMRRLLYSERLTTLWPALTNLVRASSKCYNDND